MTMARTASRGMWSVAGAWAAAFAVAASALAHPLDARVMAARDKNKLGAAKVGVSVVDVSTGETLASINEKQSFIPASNLKLLTSGTALLTLGKDFEFRTRLVRMGDVLVVVGAGDPAFADPALLKKLEPPLSLEGFVQRLADAVAKADFRGIREVVVDDRVFDREYVHPSWPADDLHRWYCAEVSGLNFHTNVLEVYLRRGGSVGGPPPLTTVPAAPWLEIDNDARVVGANGTTQVGVVRTGMGTRFRVHGTVRIPPDEPVEVTMHESGLVFGRLLAGELGRLGLGAGGGAPAARLAGPDDPSATGPVLAVVRTPLAETLSRCNKDSQNMYAEALLKRAGYAVTGQPGSWQNGAAVVRMAVQERVGLDAGELVMSDGSGLSRENRVTPLLLTRWLVTMQSDREVGDVFAQSLASGDGTLAKRFRSPRPENIVRGKSGFINQVQCLSGYVESPHTGRRIAYSVLVNDTHLARGAAKDFHEDVVYLIDAWLERMESEAGVGRKPAVGG